MNIINYNNRQLLEKPYHAEVCAYYRKNWKDFSTALHSHYHIEIMYVVSGTCVIEIENKFYSLKPNEFILINDSTYHRLIVENTSCNMVNLEFRFQPQSTKKLSIKDILNNATNIFQLINATQNFFVLKDSNEICRILVSIISAQSRNQDKELMTQLLIGELLIKLSHLIEHDSSIQLQSSTTYVYHAVEFIEKNYDKAITIQDVASACVIHPSYLQKLFKQNMGCTIIEYLTKVRLEQSKYFLTDTDLLITDIPCYIGLNSLHYYSNLFKKHTGFTPLQYRKNNKI